MNTQATLTNADLCFANFTGATGTSYATLTNSNWNLTVWTDGETYNSNPTEVHTW
jgi:uncharacterized protein YjbI with pentapeptide repeats